jgi:hypothetical protein
MQRIVRVCRSTTKPTKLDTSRHVVTNKAYLFQSKVHHIIQHPTLPHVQGSQKSRRFLKWYNVMHFLHPKGSVADISNKLARDSCQVVTAKSFSVSQAWTCKPNTKDEQRELQLHSQIFFYIMLGSKHRSPAKASTGEHSNYCVAVLRSVALWNTCTVGRN